MRITMICIGSMGDVRPYIVLGRELQKRGHQVTIGAFSEFEKAVKAEGMTFQVLSGSAKETISDLMAPNAKGLAFLRQARKSLLRILEPLLHDIEEACQDAEAIITTFFGQVVQSFAEIKQIPFIQTHYYPMDPNSAIPVTTVPYRLGRLFNRVSYDLAYVLIGTLERHYLADWRKSHGMPPRKISKKPTYELNGHTIPVLYAISPLLMPRPLAWGGNIHMTGFWLDDTLVESYQPSEELAAFLEDGEPPVYIGFGSMGGNDMEETVQIVADAIAMSGVRVILAKGWGGIGIEKQPNVFVADFIPHDWLFRRVSAVVHHGGAGTTAAGLLAAKPTLIIPFGGDQPFWGQRIHSLGLGPKPIARDRLSAHKLAKALIELTTTKKYRVAAREMSERLRFEKGEVVAANIIEHELKKMVGNNEKGE